MVLLCAIQWYGFWQICNVICLLLQYHTEYFHCPEDPLCFIYSSFPPTSKVLKTIDLFLSLFTRILFTFDFIVFARMSCSWNYTEFELFKLAAFICFFTFWRISDWGSFKQRCYRQFFDWVMRWRSQCHWMDCLLLTFLREGDTPRHSGPQGRGQVLIRRQKQE